MKFDPSPSGATLLELLTALSIASFLLLMTHELVDLGFHQLERYQFIRTIDVSHRELENAIRHAWLELKAEDQTLAPQLERIGRAWTLHFGSGALRFDWQVSGVSVNGQRVAFPEGSTLTPVWERSCIQWDVQLNGMSSRGLVRFPDFSPQP